MFLDNVKESLIKLNLFILTLRETRECIIRINYYLLYARRKVEISHYVVLNLLDHRPGKFLSYRSARLAWLVSCQINYNRVRLAVAT